MACQLLTKTRNWKSIMQIQGVKLLSAHVDLGLITRKMHNGL